MWSLVASAWIAWSAAETPFIEPVALRVVPGPCFTAPDLRSAVVDRIGDAGLDDRAPRVVRVRPLDEGQGSDVGSAEVALFVDGVPRGARRLGPSACAALRDSVVLTVALLIDPFARAPADDDNALIKNDEDSSAEPAPLAPPAAPPPAAPDPTRTANATPPTANAASQAAHDDDSFAMLAGFGAGVGSGLAPLLGPSLLARVRLRTGLLAVGLGGRLDLPAPLLVDGARRVEAGAGAAVIDVCASTPWWGLELDGCGVVEAGALRGTAPGFSGTEPLTARLATVGVAAAITAPLTDRGVGSAVFARLGLGVPVLRTALRDGAGATVWENPPVSLHLVVGVALGPPRAATP